MKRFYACYKLCRYYKLPRMMAARIAYRFIRHILSEL
jgi:hypothetical protein